MRRFSAARCSARCGSRLRRTAVLATCLAFHLCLPFVCLSQLRDVADASFCASFRSHLPRICYCFACSLSAARLARRLLFAYFRSHVCKLHTLCSRAPLAPNWRLLSSLTELVLVNTTVGGSLAAVRQLPALRILVVENAQAEANYNTDIAPLFPQRRLEVIHLTQNPNVRGTLGAELAPLAPTLTSLRLGRTSITGALPATVFQLTELHTLDLSGLDLTGTLPDALENLSLLQTLVLFGNKFTGDVPSILRTRRLSTCAVGGTYDAEFRRISSMSTNCFNAGTCGTLCYCGDAGVCAGNTVQVTSAPPTPSPPATLAPTPAPRTTAPPIVVESVSQTPGCVFSSFYLRWFF